MAGYPMHQKLFQEANEGNVSVPARNMPNSLARDPCNELLISLS